jgi:hypothetical protein
MKLEYKILYNREARTPKAQNKINALKDYLNNTLTQNPYFISIGFVGGVDVGEAQTSFNILTYIENEAQTRLDIHKYILEHFKGFKVYLLEANAPPFIVE